MQRPRITTAPAGIELVVPGNSRITISPLVQAKRAYRRRKASAANGNGRVRRLRKAAPTAAA